MTFALNSLKAALEAADSDPASYNMARVATALHQWLGVMESKSGAEMEDYGAVHDVFVDCVVAPLVEAENAEHDRVYIATKGGTDPWARI